MTEKPSGHSRPSDPRRAALVGLGVIVALVVGGMILVHVLRGTSQIQDCVMSGRTDCAPVDQATSGQ
jgi:hypothetical protein